MLPWRKYVILLADILIFAGAGAAAWLLRVGMETGLSNYHQFLPYILVSLFVGAVVFQIFRLHLHFFRFFSVYDLVHVAAATTMAVLLTVLISFMIYRLEDVQRSIPFLHWGFAMAGFSGLRMVGLMLGVRHEEMATKRKGNGRVAVMLIGYTPAADLCLKSLPIFGDRHFFATGILDENPRNLGQRLRQCEVIGHPREMEHALSQMSIHGVVVRKVFLCVDKEDLSPDTWREIERLEAAGRIELHNYVRTLRDFLDVAPDPPLLVASKVENRFELPNDTSARADLAVADYAGLKRLFDIAFALILGAILLPVMLIILPMIRLSMGSPMLFWQERPGRNGKVFRLYKLRTMSHGVDKNGHVLDDADRQTLVGRLLRRTRLDEIPQLVNVLAGDMSFVGPRPLLPIDLPEDLPDWCDLRAKVRPGLTGWAQVNGGQEVSKDDKVVMDAWYVANMSLWQDIRIIILTLKTVLKGERLDRGNIGKTYGDLDVAPPHVVAVNQLRKGA